MTNKPNKYDLRYKRKLLIIIVGKIFSIKERTKRRVLQQKFFKEITALLKNAQEVHITGYGISQLQSIHFKIETPQFKNRVANESASLKMGYEKLILLP